MKQPLLPHGPGFRLVSEIAEPEPGPLLRGRAWLNPDWPIFRDHFPGQPLLPAVYFVEIGAQLAGALWAAHAEFSPATALQLVEIKKFRVRQPAFPGQYLQLTAHLLTAWPQLATFHVQILRDETVLAEGEIVMANASQGIFKSTGMDWAALAAPEGVPIRPTRHRQSKSKML